MNELPDQFAQTALLNDLRSDDSNEHIFQALNSDNQTIEIDLSLAASFQPSYNIAPTNTSVILYMTSSNTYAFEVLKFGMVPLWSKPSKEIEYEDEDAWDIYRKEIGVQESRYFNCRRETLEQSSPIWNSSKKNRCVVPIQGYYEWQKTGVKEKTAYFVHDSTYPLIFLAGMYSHNINYKAIANVKDEYLSTFTIITGPAEKTDPKDISWLHPRKPIVLKPGTEEWNEWLGSEWKDELIDKCLSGGQGFDDIDIYQVSKDVGRTQNNGEYLTKKVEIDPKKEQPSITLFFTQKRGFGDDDKGGKRFKPEKIEDVMKNKLEDDLRKEEMEEKDFKLEQSSESL